MKMRQYINLWGKMKVTHDFLEAYSFLPAQTIKRLLHCILNKLHVNLCFVIIIIIIIISNERFDLKFVERGKNLQLSGTFVFFKAIKSKPSLSNCRYIQAIGGLWQDLPSSPN